MSIARVMSVSLVFALSSAAPHLVEAQSPADAQSTEAAQSTGRKFGISFGTAVSGSPLSEIAERNGTFAIPGQEIEFRLSYGSPRHELSLGLLADQYKLDQVVTRGSRSRLEYSSTTALVGYSMTEFVKSVPLVSSVDVGWNRFLVASVTPDYYTGETSDTRTEGNAFVLGLSYGVELPFRSVAVIPRIRITTSYPDFGGGDGYTILHPENDLGFKASFGVNVKALWRRGSK